MSTPEKRLSGHPLMKVSATPLNKTVSSPQQVLYTPSWKSRTAKLKIRKKRSSVGPSIQFSSSQPVSHTEKENHGALPLSNLTIEDLPNREDLPVKRKNPFGFLASSKKRYCEEITVSTTGAITPVDELARSSIILGGCLAGPTSPDLFDEEPQVEVLPSSLPPLTSHQSNLYSSQRSWDLSQTHPSNQNKGLNQQSASAMKEVSELPKSLALRSRFRVISESNLSHLKNPHHIFQPTSSSNDDATVESLLNESCFWVHPYFPWLKMFPRGSVKRTDTHNQDMSFMNDKLRNTVYSAWNLAFQSAYDLLRNGSLDMFFLCSSNLTMCFETQGDEDSKLQPCQKITEVPKKVSQSTRVHVVPTTRGFRDTLFKQKIKYTMPYLDVLQNDQKISVLNYSSSDLKRQNSLDTPMSSESPSPDQVFSNQVDDLDSSKDDLEFVQDQASCHDWLTGLGADQIQVSSQKSGQSVEQDNKYDYTKQSMIVIKPESVHQFFNFLLNFKSLIPASGSLAGLPPTILATKPFSGSTLQQLNMKTSSHKTNTSTSGRVNRHLFEVYGGPILPTVFRSLINKVNKLCPGYDYECHSTYAENSEAFDVIDSMPTEFIYANGKFLIKTDAKV